MAASSSYTISISPQRERELFSTIRAFRKQ
jgi:hypothetical protein